MRRCARWGAIGLVVAAGFGLRADRAAAGPDKCTVSSGTATCSGNQSAGIKDADFSSFPTTIQIQGLTGNITPATGVAGVNHFAQPNSGISSIFTKFTGGSDAIVTNGTSAHGILNGGQGHTGSGGSFGSFSAGGTGSNGGGPGNVGVTANGTITTNGTTAHGINVQALAGNSGGGGDSSCCNGGSGGDGFGGSAPSAQGSGSITTNGDQSAGISMTFRGGNGGGGGEGGLGGNGGHGGAGGVGPTVYVATTGNWSITTNGPTNSPGVRIDSVAGNGGGGGTGYDGGSGGNGGNGVYSQPMMVTTASGGWTVRTKGTNSEGIYISGTGGNGGHGGTSVTDSGAHGGNGGTGALMLLMNNTNSSADIATQGDSSSGFRVLSTGGNGGTGGTSDCCNGGNAGNGANGGQIAFGNSTTTTQITTAGDQSHGLFIVSQGGAGANGGTVGPGGSGKTGGGGGGGGSITLDGTHTITTSGTQAHGIGAFSLGGPGGKGSDGGFFNPSSGGGGSTGTSGGVTLSVGGAIHTSGAESYGIVAQSVAGHAGDAGSAGSVVSFEASGGSAGNGGTVTVGSSAGINTVSDQSAALVAQSIGGGGGSGGSGFAVFYGSGGSGSIGGSGGGVSVTNSGALTTSGDDAHAIYAQSIGGTGGDGGVEAGTAVALGGGGANASNGGSVKVVNSGTIRTGAATSGTIETGSDPTCGTGCSSGIFAQSIGGGGGNGGSTGGLISSVGGTGGGGGSGSTVEVDNTGAVGTALVNSHAILAQSVGGGGGHGGGAVTVSPGLAISVGGKGGTGGGGGTVTVNSTRGAALATTADGSHGIFAQSTGGSGGRGGFAVSVAANAASASFAVGGQGGTGGSGQNVTVNTIDSTYTGSTANSISTKGDNSVGIFAQSQGGGGGDGGFAISAAAGSTYGGLAVSVGGNGGIAGNGAAVAVTTDAEITTTGDGSDGIKAQSVGGGGGNGTFSASGALSLGGPSVSVAVGGKGGAGGGGSTVDLTSQKSISTTGDDSRGISALSAGGGGGHGGLTIAGAISTGTGGLGLAVGQSGGKGGNAAAVTLTNHGAVTTKGDNAVGIEAQSIGGGGGRGSLSFAASVSGANSLNLDVAIGGSGGTAGSGGAVSVTNTGAITTGTTADQTEDGETVTDAHGIFAQSVGGTGGSGGLAGAVSFQPSSTTAALNTTVAVGGSGGSGSLGGKVGVGNSGAITTLADASHGIFAQSVGGSGGAAGSGFAVSLEGTSSEYAGVFNLAFAVGGKGGTGSTGGEVDVSNTNAKIATTGAASHGIYAHSVGGSGGSGGSAYTMAYDFNPELFPAGAPSNIDLQVGIGGNGGTGNDGGTVQVGNSGGIQTAGDGSYGIYAYSIGGGGGDGGSASGLPTIPFTDRAKLYKSVVIEVGGTAGSSGKGGAVTVTHTAGNISTAGSGAPAIAAQSVGGGGGTGGNGAVGATGTVAIGGTGGAAGDGGDVTVAFSGGSISTLGDGTGSTDASKDIDGSYGIFAQSVGGGGGNAGNATFFGIPDSTSGSTVGGVTVGIGIGIDLEGGNAGNGGKVSVNAAGDVTTSGPNAVGIFAQSVGGGGGVSGNMGLGAASGGTAMIGSVGGQGTAGIVGVTYAGNLKTAGGGAHGIFAQSAGPSGASDVTVGVTGTVVASGTDAHGIMAQAVKKQDSSTTTGSGDISITLSPGATVQGGVAGTNNNAAGIQFLDGVTNTLTNNGLVTSAKGIAGYAVAATGGSETIQNNGHMVGNVDLGGGANAIVVGSGGRFDMGTAVALGSGNALSNGGVISPGGDDAALTTALTGNLSQGAGGSYVVTVDAAKTGQSGNNDRIDISGSADLAGKIQVEVVDAGTADEATQTTIVQTSGGTVSAATAQNLTVQSSAVGQFGLVFSNPGKVDLTYDIDFASASLEAGLGPNQEAVAEELDALHRAGLIHRDLLYLLGAEDTDAYGEALDALSPEPYGVSAWAALLSSQQFHDGLMGCEERSSDERFVADGQCVRIGVTGRRFDRDATNHQTGYGLDSGGVSLGVAKNLGDAWRVGMGAAYESWSADADAGLWRSSADQYQAGIVAERRFGATQIALSLSGGYADVQVVRNAAPGLQPSGDQDVWFAGGQLRVAHMLRHGAWYLKPRSDLSLTYTDTGSVEENGGGAAALDVEGDRSLQVALRPALELGGEIDGGNGYLMRPRFSVGITRFLTDPSPETEARFAAAGGAGQGFEVESKVKDTTLDLELGIDIISAGGVNLGLGTFGQVASDQLHLGGSARLTIPF